MMMPKQMQERRRDTRVQVTRPVKIRCADTGKYYVGTTRNVSASGAMVQVDQRLPWTVGQEVSLALAWTTRQVVLSAANMAPGKVVRGPKLDRSDHVAIEFQQTQELAFSA